MRIAVLGDFHYSRLVDADEEARHARDRATQKILDAFLTRTLIPMYRLGI